MVFYDTDIMAEYFDRQIVAEMLRNVVMLRFVAGQPTTPYMIDEGMMAVPTAPAFRETHIQFCQLAGVSQARIVDMVMDVFQEELDNTPSDDCHDCGYESAYNNMLDMGDEMRRLCETCRDDYGYCTEHSGWVHPNEGYDWDEELCNRCLRNAVPNVVRGWDFRPDLVFHPIPPEGDHPLYIGMEIEASFLDARKGRTWAGTYLPEFEDLLYAKSDASVNHGFEVVTHPMQPAWALENFPFHIFQKGIEDFGMKLLDQSTGTHIHMNKDAFTPPVLWKFLQIHMKLPEFCGIVGGRGQDASFGSFQRNSGNFLGVDRARLLEIAKQKGKFDNPERYIAVNLRNEYTIELRYMRGGTAPKEIKKNMQWALALFNFATYLDIKDVKEGALANPGYLLGYINDREDEWPELVAWISKEIPRPISLRERT